jgi:menaquinone-dependent protoporphyrinogen oxidase
VAERIAARLERRGVQVVLRRIGLADTPDDCEAAVIGSAVHDGAWLVEGERYIRDRRRQCGDRPLWMCSVRMRAALCGPVRMLANRNEQARTAELRRAVAPTGYRLFSGVIRREHLDRKGRVLFRLTGCRYGDYRDWPDVDSWADEIADRLAAKPD